MRRLNALACVAVMLGGCAGREPIPVSAYMPSDATKSCETIDSEIRSNNDGIRVRVDEDAETQNKNIVVGTAAALLFIPIAFAMDFKGTASTEANAFEQRNRTLTGLASDKRCTVAPMLTVAEATADREAKTAASKVDQSDAPGVKTPTDQRLHQTSQTGTALAAEPPSADDRARLQGLMDRFLRGELTKDEYDRLRAE